MNKDCAKPNYRPGYYLDGSILKCHLNVTKTYFEHFEYLQSCELVGHLVEEEGCALPALPRPPAVSSQQKEGQQPHLEKCKSKTPTWPVAKQLKICAIFITWC